MTSSSEHFIRCDAPTLTGDRCTAKASTETDSLTALRARLSQQGWHRTARGLDICPTCWNSGYRPDRTTNRTSTDLCRIARECRANPSQWLPVGTYRSKSSARSTASHIRNGAIATYLPAGSFDAEVRRTEAGEPIVYACYIGPNPEGSVR